MLKIRSNAFLLTLLFFLLSQSSMATILVDNGSGRSRAIANNQPNNGNVWNSLSQSFIANEKNILFGFRLKRGAAHIIPEENSTVIYNLYDGDGLFNKLLSTKIVPFPKMLSDDPRAVSGDVGFVYADFSDLNLTVGNSYTVQITLPPDSLPTLGSSSKIGAFSDIVNIYQNGRFYFHPDDGYNNDYFSDNDQLFHVKNSLCDLSDECYYIALGDSYSSGEGAGKYTPATNEKDNNLCHHSTISWNSKKPGGNTNNALPGIANMRHESYACSGAISSDLSNSSHRENDGWEKAPGPQLEEPLVKMAKLITLTIGGNDALFADVIEQCAVFEWGSNCFDDSFSWSDSRTLDEVVKAEIAKLENETLCKTYLDVKQKADGAPVIVAGYPNPIDRDEDAWGWTPEQSNWVQELNLNLWNAIKRSAAKAGVHVVTDNHSNTYNSDNLLANHFEGHGAYSTTPWINDFHNVLNESMKQESFHPNVQGQKEYALAIQEWIDRERQDNPTLSNPEPENPADPCYTLVPQAKMSAAVPSTTVGDLGVSPVAPLKCDGLETKVVPGEDVALKGLGFGPEKTVGIEMMFENSPRIFLGTASVDLSGKFEETVTVPASSPDNGKVLFRVSGDGANGGSRLLLGYSEMGDSLQDDADLDGIPNACDNCPSEANTQQTDSDADGICDACDTCPLDANNDHDNDGICDNIDPCIGKDALSLTNTSVTSLRNEYACKSISADQYEIAGTASVSFRSGTEIILGKGFVVKKGGRFRVLVDEK